MSRLHGRRARNRLLLLAAIVIVAAGGVGAWLFARSGSSATATNQLVPASLTTMRLTASSTGTIEPATTATLSFGSSGQVTAVKVGVGQKVTAGQTLATMNSASLQASLASAQASLASTQAKLASDQSTSASSAQIAADQASVNAAQSQVSSAQAALSGATLTSPIDGTVAAVGLTAGEQVGGGSGGSGSGGSGGGAGGSGTGTGSSTGSSSSSITVISPTYQVNATVDPSQVGVIGSGDQVVITGAGASPVYGTVGSIALVATSSSGVATFPVVIDVTGTPTGIYPGASVTVSIIYRQLTNVLAIPAAAIHVTNGQSFVYAMVNGQRVTRYVTTGITSGGEVQITAGLTAGTSVVVPIVRISGITGGTGGTGTGFRRGGGFGGLGGGGGFVGGGFGGIGGG